jgi:UDPglucose--hexose-1-phosphate uridylyltransferase
MHAIPARNVAVMSELRHDDLTGRSVVLAAGRAARPHTFKRPKIDDTGADACPFCPGHEADTPPEIMRSGHGAGLEPGWRVRVFPNLYPIVGGPDAHEGTTGAHEVVVLSPDHRRSFAGLDADAAIEVVSVLRDRVRAHLDDGRQYAAAIVNHLRAAGASIAHPHAQVFALDLVPPAVTAQQERFARAGVDLVARETAVIGEHGVAVASDGAPFVWCPYASPSPYVVRIAHPLSGASFAHAADDEISAVAVAVRDALRRIFTALDDPPYNLAVFTAPREAAPSFHWYVEITPRVTVTAGFEQVTGLDVNTVRPEHAAAELRAAAP